MTKITLINRKIQRKYFEKKTIILCKNIQIIINFNTVRFLNTLNTFFFLKAFLKINFVSVG